VSCPEFENVDYGFDADVLPKQEALLIDPGTGQSTSKLK
jgi:hypothetical protein